MFFTKSLHQLNPWTRNRFLDLAYLAFSQQDQQSPGTLDKPKEEIQHEYSQLVLEQLKVKTIVLHVIGVFLFLRKLTILKINLSKEICYVFHDDMNNKFRKLYIVIFLFY